MPLIILFIIGAIVLPIITAKKRLGNPQPPAQPRVNEPGRVTLEQLNQRQQSAAPARQAQQPVQQRTQPQQVQQRPQTTVVQPQSVYQYVRDAVEKAAEEDRARQQRQEELKRRLEANAARRAQEQAMGMQRKPAVQTRPTIAHEDDDCGGGSIHDGYHEGVSKFPVKDATDPVAVAGKLGKKLAEEDDAIVLKKISAENARRAMQRIQKLPPMAQGIIYSEMLGRPKSETA